jgi:hypothetical protein
MRLNMRLTMRLNMRLNMNSTAKRPAHSNNTDHNFITRRLLFGIRRIIMYEASHDIKHSARYLISRCSSCRHTESLNRAAMQPNLVYRNILITKRRKTQIKFFKTNSLSIRLYGCENWMPRKDYIKQK